MKIKQLHHFVATARHGSIAHAAEAQNISPTSIRNSIEQLETGLKIQLFVRTPAAGVVLTNDGILLLTRAKSLVEEVDDIRANFLTPDHQLKGSLVIGCQESLTWSLVPRAIDKMNKRYPKVNITVKTVWMETGFAPLENGEVDVLLTFITAKKTSNKFTVQNLCLPKSSAMMRKGHPLDNGQPVKLEDLALYPHILLADGPSYNHYMGMYAKRNLEPTVYMLSNISTGTQAVIGRTNAVSLRVIRPAHNLTPLGDQMVAPVLKDKVSRPRLISATNKIRNSDIFDKRAAFIKICHELFETGEMQKHIYY